MAKIEKEAKELLNEMVNNVELEVHSMTFNHRVAQAQQEIVAPKIQGSNFLTYKYRSCEQVLEACKPVLKKYHLLLTLNDDIVEISGRFYVKATAKILDTQSDKSIESVAFAREDESMINPKSQKQMMSSPQLTGSSSSYARKYALSGLFLLDDNKDADKIADEASQGNIQINNKLTSDEMIKQIVNTLSEERLQKALAFVNCKDITELTETQANQILNIIKKENPKKKA